MRYDDIFREHYVKFFSGMEASRLVKYEADLSALIDSDFAIDFVLIDEVLVLYDIIRDECVRRLALSCQNQNAEGNLEFPRVDVA